MGAQQRREAERRALLRAELERQLGTLSSRTTSLQTRAAILIGAATLAGAGQVTSLDEFPVALAALFSLLAALFGALASFPRFGERLSIQILEGHASKVSMPSASLNSWIFDELRDLHADDERALVLAGRKLRTGYVAIVLSLAFTALAASPTIPVT